jgi:hypothetical protein
MAVLTSKETNFVFFAINVICVLISVVCICVAYWTEISSDNDDSSYGIFFKENSSDEIVHSGCKSDMSEENCSYLNSAKSCLVISVLLGLVNIFMFLFNSGNPGFSFQSFTMGMIGVLQATFLMMCVIIFSYFKEGYLETNDDVNIEYPDEVVDASYGWAFVMMICVTVLSFAASTYHLCALSWPHALVKDAGNNAGEDESLVDGSFDA